MRIVASAVCGLVIAGCAVEAVADDPATVNGRLSIRQVQDTCASRGSSLPRWDPAECLIRGLAFNTARYFEDSTPYDGAALVAADYRPGRWSPTSEWAFAIDRTCRITGEGTRCDRVMIRVVSAKAGAKWGFEPYTTLPEVIIPYLDATLDWREADLGACPGATEILNSLGDVRWGWKPSGGGYLIMGAPPDVVVVSAWEGGFDRYYTSQIVGEGEVSAWAEKMMAAVSPCLRPSETPPPWGRERLEPPVDALPP
jgi:hypothetical protein